MDCPANWGDIPQQGVPCLFVGLYLSGNVPQVLQLYTASQSRLYLCNCHERESYREVLFSTILAMHSSWLSGKVPELHFFYMELDSSDGCHSGISEMDSAIPTCLETEPKSLLCSDCSLMLKRKRETETERERQRECRSAIDLF